MPGPSCAEYKLDAVGCAGIVEGGTGANNEPFILNQICVFDIISDGE